MLERLEHWKPFKKFLVLWEKYERVFTGISMVVGFCGDLLLANRPDSILDNTILIVYLLMAGGIIIVLNQRQIKRLEQEHPAEPILLILTLQFLFGSLSSNMLVLYGRSGTFTADALFIGFLLFMLLGNEVFKTRYGQLRFNVTIYYILTFTYLIIAVPTLVFHQIGTWVFLASGGLSLAYISLFLWAVYRFILRGKYRVFHLVEVGAYIGIVYVVFTIFYFINVIPPVPLSLKEIGIYHSVSRATAADAYYDLTFEAASWFEFWRSTSENYHVTLGNPAYCVSSVFAPTDLATPIMHSWKSYNEKTGKWEERAKISFAINGGRAQGYRGYSAKTVTVGQWRCDVETQDGRLIGRTTFTVTADSSAPALAKRSL
jgi:hypothetical protein